MARDYLFNILAGSQAQTQHKRPGALSANAHGRGTAVIALSDNLLALEPGDELDFVSLSGSTYSVVFDRLNKIKGRSITWIGHLKDFGIQYRVFISLKGSSVIGRIYTPEGLMQLRSINNELILIDYTLEEMQATPFIDDTLIPETLVPDEEAALPLYDAVTETLVASSKVTVAEAPSSLNGNIIIDVLVLYNDIFASENSNDAAARIDHLVSLANQAYLDSQVAMQIRVAGSQLVSYSNAATNNSALDAISNNLIAGVDIDVLRNQSGADLVILVRPYDRTFHGGCGLAWLNSSQSATFAFAVASDGSDVAGSNFFCSDYSFTHELGHTMGLNHDIANASSAGTHPYSYGYGVSGLFGTVMSYIDPEVGFFSNPNISSCASSPCGTAEADNARSLNVDKEIVSSFRNEVITSSDYTLSVVLSGTGMVTSNDGGINCGLDCDQLYAQNSSITLTATAGAGYSFTRWSDCPAPTNNTCEITMSSALTVTAIFNEILDTDAINTVLDSNGLIWQLTGDSNWISQSSIYQIGSSALQSGVIEHSQQNSVETSVTGPGSLSFYWKVSSELNFDALKFYIDAVEMDSIDGEVDWQQKTFAIDSGEHTLKWTYAKDGSVSSGSDAGWLDGVEYNRTALDVDKDFNGDGFSDVLLRRINGNWYLYQLDGNRGFATGSGGIAMSTDTNFEFRAAKDFNGDGNIDILGRNTAAGGWYLYHLDGNRGFAAGSGGIAMTTNTGFEFKAAKDFNNDGHIDVLGRNTVAGGWYLYLLNGNRGFAAGSGGIAMSANLNFEFKAAEDFNGDGNIDILGRNKTTGSWYLYLLDGNRGFAAGSGGIAMSTDMNFEFRAAKDFNGDGNIDILGRNTAAGGWYLYLLDGNRGFAAGSGGIAMSTNTSFEFKAAEDFNVDGNIDVLGRNKTTGGWYLYHLDGSRGFAAGSGGIAMSTSLELSYQ